MNYGPQLTPKQKAKLQQEIANVNAAKLRKDLENQDFTETQDVDAYQNWLDENGGKEPLEANPDQMPEEAGNVFYDKHVDEDIEKAKLDIMALLSGREKQVWQYVMRDGMSIIAASERLRISKQAGSQYLAKAKAKVESYFKSDFKSNGRTGE